MAQADPAVLKAQPADPSDRGALVTVGLLIERQQADQQGVVERRRARQVADSSPHARKTAALQGPAKDRVRAP
jgi:hypothetical protein